MRLLFAGTPEVALPSLQALADSDHEVVAVLTRPDTVAGRGRRPRRSPVAQWADEREIPVLQAASVNSEENLQALRELRVDAAPVVAYGALIGEAALAIPVHGWVNLHFSLLPAWRGAAPVQHALISGDEVTGATTFALEKGLDTGPVYASMTERIRPTDTAGDLLGRLAEGGAGLLLATLDGIEAGALQPQPQPLDGVSLAPKLTSVDAAVPWRAPALVIDRLIRGLTPEPGAWSTFRGERLGLGPISLLSAAELADLGSGADPAVDGLAPGQVRASKREVVVGTLDGAVRLGSVRPAGKKEMAAADWARGTRPEPEERLGD